jgi:hypothetical protein
MEYSRRSAAVLVMLLAAVVSAAQEPTVSYQIEVSVDTVDHTLKARQQVRWANTGGVPTSELWWHLYLNAFASNRTTFMRELDGRRFRYGSESSDAAWGWMRITSMTLDDGADLLSQLRFERPDDDNPDDFTVARVTLPREVPPGAAIDVALEFEARLPMVVARTGYMGDFHLVGQWFPKLGVFQGERGWNCHQFHANSEFFADFGSYRVTIDAPAGWVVGATGVEVERMIDADRQRLVFAADRVHDFAWTIAPEELMAVVEADFEPGRDVPKVWLDRARERLGLSAAELELPPMHLRLLMPRSQLSIADRVLRAIRLAVAWYGLPYGPSRYPQLTVVSPPVTAAEAGGMEYPTFITIAGGLHYALPVLERIPRIEIVAVHEFGHQYFQSLVASNEAEQGWLDEGLNSYAEVECMSAIFGDRLAPITRLGGPWPRTRAMLRLAELPLVVDQFPWAFRSFGSYVVASFDKTAVALKTLEGLAGEQPFAIAMRRYVERYRFRHPTGNDLFAVFEETTGSDLDWFFEQAFRGDGEVDWTVLKAWNRRELQPRGMSWNGNQWLEMAPDEEDPGRWSVAVEVGRRGEFIGPVEVLMVFADGSEQRRTWDGVSRWVRWRFPSQHPLVQVIVDPEGVWALEVERGDNYWRWQPSQTAARRHLWWVVDALQLLGLVPVSWS